MAHKLRPSTEAENAQVSLCDDRNQFTKVCIKHRCLPVEAFKGGYCCAVQAFKYDHNDFSIVARFTVLIPAAMST